MDLKINIWELFGRVCWIEKKVRECSWKKKDERGCPTTDVNNMGFCRIPMFQNDVIEIRLTNPRQSPPLNYSTLCTLSHTSDSHLQK